MTTGPALLLVVSTLLLATACASRPAPGPGSGSGPAAAPRRAPTGPTEPAPRPDPAPRDGPMAAPSDVSFAAGHSVLERPIPVRILGEGPETVLLLASIHGDEAVGTPLLARLGDHLRAHPELLAGRKVILVPDANPDGRRNGVRHNVRGVDLNRNFPSENFRGRARGGPRPLSEPESRALHALVTQHRPARVVSLHQPLALIDHDGPAEGLARAMAAACDLPVKKLGGRPGSMGSWVGIDLGIPIVTVELPRSADRLAPDELWRRYGPMLLAAVAYDGD